MSRARPAFVGVPAAALMLLLAFPDWLESQALPTGFLDRTVSVLGQTYRYQVFVPSSYNASQRWPVILFLHGGGERGADGLRQTHVGLGPAIRKDVARFPAIVVFPQAPSESLWAGVPARAAMAALDQTTREFTTDPDRVYLTGISMGGGGVWYLAYRNPSRFAALLPICSFVTPFRDFGQPFTPALARQLRRIPSWIVHGEVDDVVPVQQSRQATAAFKAAGAPVRYLELPGTDHNSWDAAYGSPTLMDWLFAQKRQ